MKNLALYFDIELIKAIFKNYVIEVNESKCKSKFSKFEVIPIRVYY